MTLNRKRKGLVIPVVRHGVLSTFGGRLKEALDDIGREQTWLAETIPAREGTVSNWVTDKALPAGKSLRRIVELLGCNAHWLLMGEGPKKVIYPGDAEKALQEIHERARQYTATPQGDGFYKSTKPPEKTREAGNG